MPSAQYMINHIFEELSLREQASVVAFTAELLEHRGLSLDRLTPAQAKDLKLILSYPSLAILPGEEAYKKLTGK